jgi:hypothetical protein
MRAERSIGGRQPVGKQDREQDAAVAFVGISLQVPSPDGERRCLVVEEVGDALGDA